MFVPVQFAPPAPCALLATPSPSGCAFLGRPRFFGCVAVVVVVVVADFPNSPSRPWPFPGASDPDPALAAAAAAAADLSCFAEPVRARLGAVGTTPLGPMDDPGLASTIKTAPAQLQAQLAIEVVSPILANANNPLTVVR